MFSTDFSYPWYAKGVEEITGFGMKNSLILPSLANKNFSTLRDENDEAIYTHNDEFMRHFVRQSTKMVDVQLWTNIINHLFQTKCSILFQKS